MIKTKKINNITIKPISGGAIDPKKIRGNILFDSYLPNILLCGRRSSGKTSVIYTILKKMAYKNTKVYIFSSTVHRDASYKAIIDMLEEKGCEVETFTHIYDGKENLLKNVVEPLKNAVEKETKNEPKTDLKVLCFGDDDDDEEEEKDRLLSPKVIFVMDDLSSALRDPAVSALLKYDRHFGGMCIISGHSIMDIAPDARNQLQYALLFPKIQQDKLIELYKSMELSIPFDKFLELYLYATEKPHNFLYVDNRDRYRKNFNESISF